MSYDKQTWVTGEVITANKLNHIENGIASSSGGGLSIFDFDSIVNQDGSIDGSDVEQLVNARPLIVSSTNTNDYGAIRYMFLYEIHEDGYGDPDTDILRYMSIATSEDFTLGTLSVGNHTEILLSFNLGDGSTPPVDVTWAYDDSSDKYVPSQSPSAWY